MDYWIKEAKKECNGRHRDNLALSLNLLFIAVVLLYPLKKPQNAMEVIETTGAQPYLEGEVIRVERMYMYIVQAGHKGCRVCICIYTMYCTTCVSGCMRERVLYE